MRRALESAGTATDRRMKISSRCRFSRLAHCGCVGGWGRLGAPVRACRTTTGVFAPWPGAGQLAAQHRTDGRSALLRDLAYVSPWPNLLERLAFRDCGCQIVEVIRQSVRGDGEVASARSRNHDSALSRGHQATANVGPVSPAVA